MKAVRQHELVGPKGLRVDDVDEPKPGSGEIAIEVRAAGVNFPDVLLSYGKYQFKPPAPFVPGGEVAGTVKAIGEGVSGFTLGQRVAATMLHGAFAEVVVVPALAAVPLPDAVSFETGAATLLTYLTTIHALEDRGHLAKGESLLVLGAAGGVGLAAIELGKVMGARVIAAASTDEKLAVCREHGADETIAYEREDLKERVKALTKGDGVNVVYDPVGGKFAEPSLRAIAWEGRYLVVGFAAGDIPKIPLNLTLLKGCQICGVFWGSFAMREPMKNRANADRVLAWVASGALRPRVDKTFSFADAAQGIAHLESRSAKGKVVLVP